MRESFGYPWLLSQLLSVTWCLRQKTPHWRHLSAIALSTSGSLVTWQFSQFVFVTQIIALSLVWMLNSSATFRSSLGVIFLGKLVVLMCKFIKKIISIIITNSIRFLVSGWITECYFALVCQSNASYFLVFYSADGSHVLHAVYSIIF